MYGIKKYFSIPIYVFIICCAFHFYSCKTQDINYSIIAHSHNGYEQDIPIKQAISLGFTSLEVDIVYHEGIIRVSHDYENLENKPEFESGYLVPFLENVHSNKVYTLLVDFKNYSPELLDQLRSIFNRHSKYLVKRNVSSNLSPQVQIILSGQYPRELVIEESENEYLFVDGRMQYLNLELYDGYTPWISMNMARITDWKGVESPSQQQLHDLQIVIEQVHSRKKQIRFWNTSDNELTWKTLFDLGVDIIGVDDLQKFHDWYTNHEK